MDPTIFDQQLLNQQKNFELVTALGQEFCHIRFSGPFQGEPIIWDAYLQTLSYYVSKHSLQDQPTRQFIEVGDSGEAGRLIHLGLNLPKIDEPVILKSLIMVRQYKRLSPGRHEFGERFYFPK